MRQKLAKNFLFSLIFGAFLLILARAADKKQQRKPTVDAHLGTFAEMVRELRRTDAQLGR